MYLRNLVAPYRTLERLFSLLDLSLLRIMPLACIVPFDFLSDFYVRLRRLVGVCAHWFWRVYMNQSFSLRLWRFVGVS